MSVGLKAPTDRSRSDCVHEQVAERIANVRFTRRIMPFHLAISSFLEIPYDPASSEANPCQQSCMLDFI